MTRQNSAVEFINLSGGLITESGPLTFPPNATIDENNFDIGKDGSRYRRLGIQMEKDVMEFLGSFSPEGLVTTNYVWESPAGLSGEKILVVQLNSSLSFYRLERGSPVSDGWLESIEVSSGDYQHTPLFSYSTLAGKLVVASGHNDPYVFTYDEDGGLNKVTSSRVELRIRDLFGVDVEISGVDLNVGDGLTTRPPVQNMEHIYNLRNQGWMRAVPAGSSLRLFAREGAMVDPLYYAHNYIMHEISSDTLTIPSNSDTLGSYMSPDPGAGEDSQERRFWPNIYHKEPGKFAAPRGHFIISPLDRSWSRTWTWAERDGEIARMYASQAELLAEGFPGPGNGWSTHPGFLDRTLGGPRVVSSFAGRVWYGGFGNRVLGNYKTAPDLGSMVLFSQVSQQETTMGNCYQKADPTDMDDPDLVDTDGGFIRLDGARDICKMVVVGPMLLVFASNGIWSIMGGEGGPFTATGYLVSKMSDVGTEYPNTIVETEGGLMFWSEGGIYMLSPSEVGSFQVENISKGTIQTLYDNIPDSSRGNCSGKYDKISRKVSWTYFPRMLSEDPTQELVFNFDHRAFTKKSYPLQYVYSGEGQPTGQVYHRTNRMLSPSEVFPYQTARGRLGLSYLCFISSHQVGVGTVHELKMAQVSGDGLYDLDVTGVPGGVEDNFSAESPDAYLITGHMPGQDFQRYKQVPYLTTIFTRTEDGFDIDEEGDLYPTKPSSCLVQARWEWANSPASGRWGREFQAYRYRRHFIPEDLGDKYDTGFEVITTKNKIRGKGKVLSLMFKAEPGKDCRIVGWSMTMGTSGNV